MNNKLAKWSLRIGLAFVFMYASIEMFFHPENFLKYMPSFILHIIPEDLFLYGFGIAEFLLAIWILMGKKSNYAALISIFLMVSIIVFNMEHFHILFRNVAIAFGAVALYLMETNSSNDSSLLDKKRSSLFFLIDLF